jgi:hypothetical protein
VNNKNIYLQVTKFALGYDFAKDYVFDMARKKVMKQTNGLYPAPLRILEVRHPNILLLWSAPVFSDPGCLSLIEFFPSRIPDPNFSHPGSLPRLHEDTVRIAIGVIRQRQHPMCFSHSNRATG